MHRANIRPAKVDSDITSAECALHRTGIASQLVSQMYRNTQRLTSPGLGLVATQEGDPWHIRIG